MNKSTAATKNIRMPINNQKGKLIVICADERMNVAVKKAVAIVLVSVLLFSVYIGILPNEYSFFEGNSISAGKGLYTLDLGTEEVSAAGGIADNVKQGKYEAKLKLFGFLPIKTARINIIKNEELIPLGVPFGVKLYTEGVIVIGMTDVAVDGKKYNPAYEAGIREGDIILSYNGVKIKSNEELAEQVASFDGKTKQKAQIRRKNLEFDTEVQPIFDDISSGYRIGAWVRDSTAGIGTLTYLNKKDNTLGGLGHSISDVDTGLIMPVMSGDVVKAVVQGIQKGDVGTPGELLGVFDDSYVYGTLNNNMTTGLFADCTTEQFDDLQSYPIALKKEIKTAKASIISCVEGSEPETYEIEILKINNNLQNTKNMVIKITDERLLKKTGGIVQGMSGSPIIQNGKLIGAVTHVLVSDPTKGYAIFIERMLLGE